MILIPRVVDRNRRERVLTKPFNKGLVAIRGQLDTGDAGKRLASRSQRDRRRPHAWRVQVDFVNDVLLVQVLE